MLARLSNLTPFCINRRNLGLLALCMALTGCGGSDNSQPSGNPSPSSALPPPLPSPPLTAPPLVADEPQPEPAELNSAVTFVPLQNTAVPLATNGVSEVTDAVFDAGTPAPVVSNPDDIDLTVNPAPFFEGLENISVLAGDMVEIIYRPQDPDGSVPGMFPVKLPRDATFDDNFDGSKTFRWQPLQQDAGIQEFAVTAVDSTDQSLRYTQAIYIKVGLPADESTIPNVAPTLERLPDIEYVARVGDPVVIEFKGLDRNGTFPTVDMPSPPAGATFVPHPTRLGNSVLKYVPTTTGPQSFDVLIRDGVEPTLVTPETLTITILDAEHPARMGDRLRDLAANRGVSFGFALSQDFYQRADGALYADIATDEFDLVSPESSMKMSFINPLPGRYDFADTDNLVNFAQANDMMVHGHPLVWHRQLPAWLRDAPASNLQGHMQEHIDRLMTRYRDRIAFWDVVNEPVDDAGGLRESIWFQAMGEDYIDIALKQARATAPDALLLINEYDIAVPGPKADTFFELLERLQSRNVPLDGVGFQLHVFSTFDQFDEVRAAFQRVADLGLDIYITEMDVALPDASEGTRNNSAVTNAQADVFEQLVTICLEQSRCQAIQTWGFTDQYSFRRRFSPLLFDRQYTPKSTYDSVQRALAP